MPGRSPTWTWRPPATPLLAAMLAATVATGCGRDPILDRADELGDADGQAQQGGDAPPPPGTDRAPAPGDASAPVPGDAASPQAGTPEPPAPGVPDDPPSGDGGAPPPGGGPQVTGPVVVLAGTVTAKGWDGAVRLDVFDGDQRNLDGPRPSVVAVQNIATPGAFQIRVPKDSGQVWLGAYADTNGNGRPDRDDPQAWYGGNPVSTTADAQGLGLELVIGAAEPADDL